MQIASMPPDQLVQVRPKKGDVCGAASQEFVADVSLGRDRGSLLALGRPCSRC